MHIYKSDFKSANLCSAVTANAERLDVSLNKILGENERAPPRHILINYGGDEIRLRSDAVKAKTFLFLSLFFFSEENHRGS